MKKIITLLFVLVFSFSGCEKDDICDANTPTTPRLVIEFYSISNSSVVKNVTNLKVIGDGMTNGIAFSTAIDGSQYVTNGSKIYIPLKTDANSTTYSFILNYGNTNTSFVNEDKITFNYTHRDVFVSRACGYKTLFTLNPTNTYTQTAVPVTSAKWIQYISVEKNNIDNENETHIKVYF
jgi:Family of unknown function (DUF6452)